MDSGDGWTTCAAGHNHWGLFGAAGLLLIDGTDVVLQHRAPWTHEGDTWGLPGGARNSGEDAVSAALREANEEAALDPSDIDSIGLFVDDHQGWSYTTVVALPRRTVTPFAANAESVSVRWHAISEVAGLVLHNGFARTWLHLQDVPQPLYLLVSEVVARDPLLAVLQRTGVSAERLPAGISSGGLTRLLPRVVTATSVDDAAVVAVELAKLGQVLTVNDVSDLRRLS
jgi:8-oxo-dGTP pyrophosphatase MutT (NUDIX family)